ncbi:DNA-directed RNA polymerase subunit alpha C-terminal domain-containing protein [Novosphingobium sp. TCA1]|uniref:DNA-directed RNA polymerase subunit alpha C-terminal domain-containing protein n=1 Tax=Novosphingobium sp. TCA1 TaxID=2682474 RepID=UPI001307B469|nr:DNA-directed RNA polymerase subunit alpha C-terminal domain-containing protein [Novosphingobium sp. TCA1]GFE76156.1 hypothetical protein NTCA1_38050 [Novosphingobium sp. TCA1]
MRIEGRSALILAHPADLRFAKDLADALETLDGQFDLAVIDILAVGQAMARIRGLCILVLSPQLRSAPEYPRLHRELKLLAQLGSLEVVEKSPDLARGEFPLQTVVRLYEAEPKRNTSALSRIGLRIIQDNGLPIDPQSLIASELFQPIGSLELPGRTYGVLERNGITLIGDLVQRGEADLLRISGFGRHSLADVKDALRARRLRLGMDVGIWRPIYVDDEETKSAASAKAERAALLAQLKQARGGATFEPEGDHLTMVTAAEDGDRIAALKPMTGQMQTALLEKARTLAGFTARLDNQPGWTGLGRAAATLTTLLENPTEDIPDVLGLLYPNALELGSFVELDEQISAGAVSYALPLDPEVQRSLKDVVRTLAPWLRMFPSAREADEEAGRFLVKAADLKPTFEVINAAKEQRLVTPETAALLEDLEGAAERGTFQGEKAGGWIKRTTRNLVTGSLSLAGIIVSGAVASDYSTTSPLIHRIGQFLTCTEIAITEVIKDLPQDLQFAVREFVTDLRAVLPPPPAADTPAATGTTGVNRFG